jgi:hypothetical protein
MPPIPAGTTDRTTPSVPHSEGVSRWPSHLRGVPSPGCSLLCRGQESRREFLRAHTARGHRTEGRAPCSNKLFPCHDMTRK